MGMGNVFLAEDPWAGASESIRRCLTHIKQNAPFLLKLGTVAQEGKLPFKVCFWVGEAWAHIGFPKHKTAIVAVSTRDAIRDQTFRDAWKKEGWECLVVRKQDILSTPLPALVAQLLDAIKAHKK